MKLARKRAAASTAERQARFRALGRRVDVVIRDLDLLAELDTLTAERGSVRAAVQQALLASALNR
jgi:hypothetical protein